MIRAAIAVTLKSERFERQGLIGDKDYDTRSVLALLTQPKAVPKAVRMDIQNIYLVLVCN